MLKPTKKFTKKEIQRDPFLESIDKAQTHISESKSIYMKAAIALIIIVIGYNVISEKQSQKNENASEALGQALVALDIGDNENAQFQLETLTSEFKGTRSSQIAGYYLGKLNFEAENYSEAKIYLSQFLKDKPIETMIPAATIMLADIAIQAADTKTALNYIEKGIRKSEDAHTLRMLSLQKANLILKSGDSQTAKTIASTILSEENITAVQKQAAEELLGKIPG
ncbi:MAG: tetratricopeptide repeat protein [Candidatus Marinimicrobia bacterium]|jgi:predicted negative regulator of RcsB-dependent stress response|nr:tetratricopeptide repeat protein [Candidatus Neomarinimicrobiota bacterium]MBT3502257.1 tetratricopeptide repeat protein [Candidatus Neomarinimicrobiota bacterium]MBT3840335.1 tetratricopeptide repeat protein [Candidatus Neomarinimicrobiota bacterium]MBT3998545.1 tetratricopeptide repeat protein [Candidatus Neomarinimicrobiota bacterium]MBT4283133.1 tetratricopeptide repeat protein [Candidatus Neomarinimicrobiota bacterium]